MRVLQLSDYHVHGGDGHPLNNICQRLHRRGHRVEVYTSDLKALPIPFRDEDSPIPITRFRGIRVGGKAIYPGMALALILRREFGIVHTHVAGFFSTFVAALLKPLKGYPLVITADFDPAEPMPGPLKYPYFLLYRALPARLADVVTAFTEKEKRELVRRFGVPVGRIAILPIGIDFQRFASPSRRDVRRELGMEDRFVLLNVSFLLPKKNLEMVLRALATLPEEVVFVHIGAAIDRGYRERLEGEAARLGVGERTVFLEDIPFEDFPEYYKAADAFVQPGFRESYAIPILEAMASGIPVLATEEGVAPEVVEEGVTGFFIRSAEDLAARVRQLSEGGGMGKEMGARAREKAAAYDWERAIDRLEEIYARVASL